MYSIYRVFVFFYVIKQSNISNKTTIKVKTNKNKRLYFILPVYKELELIRETMNYYSDIVKKHSNFSLIVVGNCKERNNEGSNETLEIAKKGIQKMGYNIHIIEYPFQGGYMGHQDNYAIEYISTIEENYSDIWLHFINIDTRFRENYFNEIQSILQQSDGSDVLVQSSLFVLNYSKLPRYMRGLAIYQSRWTIVAEQRRLLFNAHISNKKLYHVVGHGLIIKLPTFNTLKQFPTETLSDDLHFGYYLSTLGIKIGIIKSYEIADMPNTINERFSQTQLWFRYLLEYRSFYKHFNLKFGNTNKKRAFIMMIQGYINASKWLLLSIINIITLFYVFYYKQRYLGVIFILQYGTYLIHYLLTHYWLLKRQYISENPLSLIATAFGYFTIPMYVSFSPLIALVKTFLEYLGIKKYTKTKTTHQTI